MYASESHVSNGTRTTKRSIGFNTVDETQTVVSRRKRYNSVGRLLSIGQGGHDSQGSEEKENRQLFTPMESEFNSILESNRWLGPSGLNQNSRPFSKLFGNNRVEEVIIENRQVLIQVGRILLQAIEKQPMSYAEHICNFILKCEREYRLSCKTSLIVEEVTTVIQLRKEFRGTLQDRSMPSTNTRSSSLVTMDQPDSSIATYTTTVDIGKEPRSPRCPT